MWHVRNFGYHLAFPDGLAARYLARQAQDLNTSRPALATRPNLLHGHPDPRKPEDARYALETKAQFNVSDPPIPPASPKASDNPSVCSGSGRLSVTPPEVVDIDGVDQEIIWQ